MFDLLLRSSVPLPWCSSPSRPFFLSSEKVWGTIDAFEGAKLRTSQVEVYFFGLKLRMSQVETCFLGSILGGKRWWRQNSGSGTLFKKQGFGVRHPAFSRFANSIDILTQNSGSGTCS